MVNRCPNCGGLLNYDISAGQLKCESCDSLFSPEEYADNTAAKEDIEAKDYSVSIFTCPNCGGSISSNEAEAVEYCLYCGSFVTLNSQVEKVSRPNFIIPFSRTKEDCIKSYSGMIKRKLYAPKEFRNKEFLGGFKGIYIPYWTYGYEFGPDISLNGVTETRNGDYITKHHYTINCKAQGELDGISYDASSTFDDDISGRITPYDTKKLVPFKTPYMFGFYADTADIDAEVYHEDAAEIARDEIWDKVTGDPQIKNGELSNPERPSTGKAFDNTFKIKERRYLSMLPVWFLTWRNKDRVAYSVVNGESGAIYSEVPVDIKRYIMFSLIFAVPIFMLLNWLTTFNAKEMLWTSVILSLFMIVLYSLQLDKIVRKQFHADDKGYLTMNRESREAAENIKGNLIVEFFKGAGGILKGAGLGGIVIGLIFLFTSSGLVLVILVGVILFILIYSFYRIGKNRKLMKGKHVWLDVLGSLISLGLSFIMLMADPAGDEFYYIAALLCIAGVGLTAIFTMKRYNDLVTRPLPHFFDRKKGGEN